jgi:hypothetical protein
LFVYRLALEHGIWDVENWKRSITLDQLKRWMAFYRVEPFGQDWRRSARATMFTVTAAGAKVREEFEEMFLPTYDPSRPTQTEEEMLAELMKIPQIRKAARGDDR